PEKLAFVTQTTLSMDDTAKVIEALKRRFPSIQGPKKNDICYATQNRQDAVKELAEKCDLVLVVGSPNSSNSNRLREIAEQQGTVAHLIDGEQDILKEWLENARHIGVTAGASAPEILVEQVIQKLETWGASKTDILKGKEENIVFSLPEGLRDN
ncbi:MAG: 4-hydroxy-3-methylbut-2-enyl diphosphate reductase, partial [Sedimenticola sp.]